MDHAGEPIPVRRASLSKWSVLAVALSLLAILLCLWFANKLPQTGIKWLDIPPPGPPSNFAKYKAKLNDFVESIRTRIFGQRPKGKVWFEMKFASVPRTFTEKSGFPGAFINSDGSMAWILDSQKLQTLRQNLTLTVGSGAFRDLRGKSVLSLQQPAALDSTIDLYDGIHWGLQTANQLTYFAVNAQRARPIEVIPSINGEEIMLALKVGFTQSITNLRPTAVVKPSSSSTTMAEPQAALEATIPKGGGAVVWIKGAKDYSSGFLMLILLVQTNQPPMPTFVF
jgi:hypothetical protein